MAGDFFRAQQTRGMPARLRTEAFVLYDAVAIYVGFRCWEPDMTRLRETLTRRDTRMQYDEEGTILGLNFWRARPIDQESYSWSDTGGAIGRVDLIYQPSRSLIGNLTVFLDFSQLESDPTLINVNDDRELSLPERRPFFRDGAELFDLPLRLFYTRRVQEIDLGVKATGRTGGYTWAALNTYGKVIDRYDGDAKRRANLVNLRLNRDIGERTVIGAIAVHKHQEERDAGLLSVNGRLGLGYDWTATGQLVGNSTGGSHHFAYHASTNWRNQSGFSGSVELEEIRAGFRPNETGLEDEAYRRAWGNLTFVDNYSEGSRLNALLLRGRVFRQTDETGRLRQQYAQAEGSLHAGLFRLLHSGPRRRAAGSGTPLEHAVRRCHRRLQLDVGLRPRPQPDRHSAGRLHLVRQPGRQGQPVRAADDQHGRGPFLLVRDHDRTRAAFSKIAYLFGVI